MFPNDAEADGESEAGSAVDPGIIRFFRREKRVEHPSRSLVGHSRTGVPKGDADRVAVLDCLDFELSVSIHGFYGVLDNVDEHLTDAVFVEPTELHFPIRPLKLDPPILQLEEQNAEGVVYDFDRRDRRVDVVVRLEARHIEELGENAARLLRVLRNNLDSGRRGRIRIGVLLGNLCPSQNGGQVVVEFMNGARRHLADGGKSLHSLHLPPTVRFRGNVRQYQHPKRRDSRKRDTGQAKRAIGKKDLYRTGSFFEGFRKFSNLSANRFRFADGIDKRFPVQRRRSQANRQSRRTISYRPVAIHRDDHFSDIGQGVEHPNRVFRFCGCMLREGLTCPFRNHHNSIYSHKSSTLLVQLFQLHKISSRINQSCFCDTRLYHKRNLYYFRREMIRLNCSTSCRLNSRITTRTRR